MSTVSSSSSSSLTFYSRKLLLHTTSNLSPNSPVSPHILNCNGHGHGQFGTHMGEGNFDANVVMVLSVLLCALVCALGLNSIIRCVLRCSNQVAYNSGDNTVTSLANTGIKKKALKTFPIVTYLTGLPGLDTECVICLSEFAPGDRLRVLPKCNHGFHIRCIDKWLISHSSCPTCRHCLLKTCKKIVGCSQPTSSTVSLPPPPPPPPPSQRMSIVPLEHEGYIRNLEGIC